MSASISEFAADLDSALLFESERIDGYTAWLSVPDNLVDQTAKAEIQEALGWSMARHGLIGVTVTYVRQLIDHGYPNRVEQIADDSVIAGLSNALRVLSLSVNEFHEPPVAELQVSKEIAL